MDGDPHCKRCGAELTGQAVGGHCANCLLKLALDPPGQKDEPTAGVPPTPLISGEFKRVRYFGDYELLEEIARGGMGVVYRARQVSLNRSVALKMILTGDFSSAATVERFQTEAEAAARLEHPNIVPIYEIGAYEGQRYFSMRFLEGGTLTQAMAREKYSPRRAAELLMTVARAVHHAHQHGILHRDLKPGNILFDQVGQPYVADFGLAKVLDHDGTLTQSAAVMGTPSYMSPEQASGHTKQLTTSSDVFSLGAILYEMLTGRPQFRGVSPVETMRRVMEEEPQPPQSLNSEVAADLQTICLKCLQKDSVQRYASADALAEDLERWLRGEPIQARPTTSIERAIKWMRREPAKAALVVVSCIALGALIGIALGQFAFRAEQEQRMKTEAALKTADEARRSERLQRTQTETALAESRLAREAADKAFQAEQEQRKKTEAALNEAELQRLEAEKQRALVKEGELQLDRVQYAEKLHLAELALRDKSPGRTLEILEGLKPASAGMEDLRAFEWHYLWQACNGYVAARQLSGEITGLAYDPERNWFAASSSSGEIETWQAGTGETTARLAYRGSTNEVVSFLTSGKLLVRPHPYAPSRDVFLNLWDPQTGITSTSQLIRQAPTSLFFRNEIVKVVTDRRGELAAIRVENNILTVWEISSGREVFSHPIANDGVWAFSGDGKHVAIASDRITVYSLTSDPTFHGVIPGSGVLANLTFCPTGRKLVATHRKQPGPDTMKTTPDQVLIWEPGINEQSTPLQTHQDVISVLAFGRGGDWVASAGGDGAVKVWSISNKTEITAFRDVEPVKHLAISSDGDFLVTAGASATLRTWRLAPSDSTLSLSLPKNDNGLHSVNFLPTPKDLRSGLVGWDYRSGQRFTNATKSTALLGLVATGIGSVVVSRDGTVAAFANRSGFFTLKEINSGRVLGGFRPRDPITHEGVGLQGRICFSPDGKWIAGGSEDGRVVVMEAFAETVRWDLKAVKFDGAPKTITWDVTFNPHGNLLASAHSSGKEDFSEVMLWDMTTGALLKRIPGPAFTIWSIAFSPDGSKLAAACGRYHQHGPGEVVIWNVQDGTRLHTLKGHNDCVWSVAFSPDGRRVVSGAGQAESLNKAPAEVKIWDSVTGFELCSLPGQTNAVFQVVFSPDGKRIASASGTHEVVVWSIP